MQSIQAVIFDLDDTLYPEKSYTFSGYRAVAHAHSDILGDPEDTHRRMCELFDSPDRAKVFNVLLEEAGISDPAPKIAEMIESFRAHVPTIEFFPDAANVLKELRPNYQLGIISDGYLVAQQNKVAALRLAANIDEIILTDELGREFWKPHAKAFKQIAERLNTEHHACVYVADNLAKDFVAPNALGWQSIFVDRPEAIHRSNQPPDGGNPRHTIKTLAELPTLLTALA